MVHDEDATRAFDLRGTRLCSADFLGIVKIRARELAVFPPPPLFHVFLWLKGWSVTAFRRLGGGQGRARCCTCSIHVRSPKLTGARAWLSRVHKELCNAPASRQCSGKGKSCMTGWRHLTLSPSGFMQRAGVHYPGVPSHATYTCCSAAQLHIKSAARQKALIVDHLRSPLLRRALCFAVPLATPL